MVSIKLLRFTSLGKFDGVITQCCVHSYRFNRIPPGNTADLYSFEAKLTS